MKFIIQESKLYGVFKKYMDSQYDLRYIDEGGKFVDKYGDMFGYIFDDHFYYISAKRQNELYSLFGWGTSNELLFYYLQKRFPDMKIDGVE